MMGALSSRVEKMEGGVRGREGGREGWGGTGKERGRGREGERGEGEGEGGENEREGGREGEKVG